MTKLFGLGVLGAGVYAVARAAKQRTALRDQQDLADVFDDGDLDEAVVVDEEIIVVTEAGPYEIEMELIPADERVGQQQGEPQQPPQEQPAQQQAQQPTPSEPVDMPGRGAGPR